MEITNYILAQGYLVHNQNQISVETSEIIDDELSTNITLHEVENMSEFINTLRLTTNL